MGRGCRAAKDPPKCETALRRGDDFDWLGGHSRGQFAEHMVALQHLPPPDCV